MARKKKEVLPPEHCASVREYEMSPYWKKKSQAILDDKECVCEICGRRRWTWMPRAKKWKKRPFGIHHIRYNHCPHEQSEDLMILCRLCHNESHTLLQYKGVCTMFERISYIVREYFHYEGIDTFTGW